MDPSELWDEHCRQNIGDFADYGIAWAQDRMASLHTTLDCIATYCKPIQAHPDQSVSEIAQAVYRMAMRGMEYREPGEGEA